MRCEILNMKIKLNLIPPQRKEEIKKAYWLRLVSRWEIEFVLLLLLFIAVLASMNFILKINIATETDSVLVVGKDSDKYDLISEYDKEIKDISGQVASVKKIQDNQLYWSRLLLKLNEKVFDGLEITDLTTSDYAVVLDGKANTRDDLIAFKDSLVQDQCFSNVELPLSNLVSKDNVEFQISLAIKKECLKYEQ